MNQTRAATCFAIILTAAWVQALATEGIVEKPAVNPGDRWVYQRTDLWANKPKDKTEFVVSAASGDDVEMRMTVLESDNPSEIGKPATEKWDWGAGVRLALVESGAFRYYDFPMQVGKKWAYNYRRAALGGGLATDWDVTAEAQGWEEVVTRAGTFRALHIRHTGGWRRIDGSRTGTLKMDVWYAPQVRRFVAEEYEDAVGGRSYNRLRRELLEYQLAP